MKTDTGCRFILALAVCLTAAAPAEAQFSVKKPSHEDYHVEAGAAFWTPEPDILLRFNSGPEINLISLFEIDTKRFRDWHAIIKPARKHKIRVQHVNVSYEKEKTFTTSLPARTDLEWDVWRLGYEWDVVSGAGGFLGVIGEVKLNHVVASITSTPLSGAATADHRRAVPAIGGIIRGYVSKNVSLTAESTFLTLSKDGVERANFVDYDVSSSLNVNRHLVVQAGYRSMTIDYLVDNDEGKLKAKGPYFGASIRF